MTVADYIAKFLVSKGVKHVFGFQGSAMLKMLDSIASTGCIEYIQGFHEQAAAFAADGYARAGGGVGVVIATSGPGASNLMTGVANAYFDSVPMLVLTGQDRRAHICAELRSRQNGFQDMDVVSMAEKITKRAVQVLNPTDLANELDFCWTVSQTGRKGPVLIDVPMDLQFEEMPDSSAVTRPACSPEGHAADSSCLEKALGILKSAKRPVILVGGGVRLSGACARVDAFSRDTRIPVVATLMGLDAVKGSLGFTGLYGNPLPNRILREADCILALGTRFAFHQTGKAIEDYSPQARIVHVDVDKAELGRVFHDSVLVNADISAFLDEIERMGSPVSPDDWLAQIARWHAKCDDTLSVFPAAFLRRLFSVMPQDAITTADVGSNQMWVAQSFIPTGYNRLLNSGGLGAMGFSLPAAIGASYASRSPVVAICGDGGFQMNVQELNTLALRRRNVKVFVLNNSSLGLMRAIQRRHYGSRFTGNSPSEFTCPDISRLAEAYGLNAMRIGTAEDFDGIQKLFGDCEPWLVDVAVGADDIAPIRYDREVCG